MGLKQKIQGHSDKQRLKISQYTVTVSKAYQVLGDGNKNEVVMQQPNPKVAPMSL